MKQYKHGEKGEGGGEWEAMVYIYLYGGIWDGQLTVEW